MPKCPTCRLPEQCPRWRLFIAEVFGDDIEAVELLQDWFYYVLTGRTDLHKMLLWIGPKRGGKGTVARVLKKLIGADAYTGLANIYNSQKKFDLAAEASANASKYTTAASGGGAEASFNQGVILFNSQKYAEAKTQFEAAVKADPNMAMAQYQLGMTALNLGQFADAVTALEAYLKVDPNGPKAAEVKASLPALQAMVKK